MRLRIVLQATALILVALAVLGSYLFQAKPVLSFQAGRGSATLHLGVASTTGKVELFVSGAGTYTITSIVIKVTDYSIYALVPTTFVLDASENLPITLSFRPI